MSELSIDINSDLGESEESLANGIDAELMRYITSANVACGGHAGNDDTMARGTAYCLSNTVSCDNCTPWAFVITKLSVSV